MSILHIYARSGLPQQAQQSDYVLLEEPLEALKEYRWQDVSTGEIVSSGDIEKYGQVRADALYLDLVRVDSLPGEAQLQWLCFKLNYLESLLTQAQDFQAVANLSYQITKAVKDAAPLAEEQRLALFKDASTGTWNYRQPSSASPGDSIKVVALIEGFEEYALKQGVVIDARFVDPGCVRVRLDGVALCPSLPLWAIEVIKLAPEAKESDRSGLIIDEIAELEAIKQAIEAEIAELTKLGYSEGWIVEQEKNGKIYFLYQYRTESRKRKSHGVKPNEVSKLREKCDRWRRIESLSSKVTKIAREIDRLEAVRRGHMRAYAIDGVKDTTTWKVFDSRDGRLAEQPQNFTISVGRWKNGYRGRERRVTYKEFTFKVYLGVDSQIQTATRRAAALAQILNTEDHDVSLASVRQELRERVLLQCR